jgi:hypothetical protein
VRAVSKVWTSLAKDDPSQGTTLLLSPTWMVIFPAPMHENSNSKAPLNVLTGNVVLPVPVCTSNSTTRPWSGTSGANVGDAEGEACVGSGVAFGLLADWQPDNATPAIRRATQRGGFVIALFYGTRRSKIRPISVAGGPLPNDCCGRVAVVGHGHPGAVVRHLRSPIAEGVGASHEG